MKRRHFLKTLLLGGVLFLFGKKAGAEKKPDDRLTIAMFWKKVD